MKNKQRKRRSLAVIAILILCILPILTFGASAAEADRDEVFVTEIDENLAWRPVRSKVLNGTDWFIDNLQNRFDYGIPDMLYAFEMGSYKHFVYGTEWFDNLDPGFFTDQTMVIEDYFLGSGVFAFHGDIENGITPRSVFPAEMSVAFHKGENYDVDGYCTDLTVQFVAQSTVEDRMVSIWITMFAAETEQGVGYYVDSHNVTLIHFYNGNQIFSKANWGSDYLMTIFAAMDLNSSLMTGYPITDVRQFMQIYADVEDVNEILFFPAEYYAGYEEGYDLAAKQGTDRINALEAENKDLHTFALTEYNRGFGEGQTDAYNAKNTLGQVIFQIFDAPVQLINGMLDFELFGINVASTVKTLLTLAITAAIVFLVVKLKS